MRTIYVTRPSLFTINTQIAGHLCLILVSLSHSHKRKTSPHTTPLYCTRPKFLSLDQNYLPSLTALCWRHSCTQATFSRFPIWLLPSECFDSIHSCNNPNRLQTQPNVPLFGEVGEGQKLPSTENSCIRIISEVKKKKKGGAVQNRALSLRKSVQTTQMRTKQRMAHSDFLQQSQATSSSNLAGHQRQAEQMERLYRENKRRKKRGKFQPVCWWAVIGVRKLWRQGTS